MALDVTPSNLRDEIRQSCAVMRRHTDGVKKLVRRYTGGFYKGREGLDVTISENIGYEVVSRVVPKFVYKNPRFIVSADNPLDGPPGGTMNDVAMGISAFLNRWSSDNQFELPLTELAYDFLFGFGVALCYTQDYPGRQAFESLQPRKPCVTRVDPAMFGIDYMAKSASMFSHDGPRYMFHMWRADKDDLLGDDAFDQEQVKAMATDTDVEDYQNTDGWDNQSGPGREQIYAWDVWIPEHSVSKDRRYNGSWHTVAAMVTEKGRVTKKTYQLRRPRPAYCPNWGPYTLFGAYKVPDSPVPMSPLMATAEAAEETNAHAVQVARDARSYKRFAVGQKMRQGDANTVKNVRHAQMVVMDDPESVSEKTIGGVQPEQFNYLGVARERLNRLLGLSSALRTSPDPNVTATAENIAASASNIILDGLQKAFRSSVEQVARSVAFYAFYDDDIRSLVRTPDGGVGVYQGGLQEGQDGFDFYDLSVRVEPYSLEHTDQNVLQRRFMDVFSMVAQAAPGMAQAPYVRWDLLLNPVLDTLNAGTLDGLINTQLINQIAGIQIMTEAQRNLNAGGGRNGGGGGGGYGNAKQGTPTRETAAELAGNALV